MEKIRERIKAASPELSGRISFDGSEGSTDDTALPLSSADDGVFAES
jgi:uncharacterized protein YdhG (YjbR/CyaY superfamily)